MAAALAAAKAADVVVLCLGIDKSIEHEGHDRSELTLPGLQEEFGLQAGACLLLGADGASATPTLRGIRRSP